MGSITSIPIDVQALQDNEAYWKEQYAIVMQENTGLRELVDELQDDKATLIEQLDRCHARINDNESERAYTKRMLANDHMEPAHKLVLKAIRDEIRARKVDQQGLTRIDYASIGQKVGLSRQTATRRANELVEWGAFGKFVEKVPSIVKGGRTVNKEHVYLSLNTIAVEAPEDIKPQDEPLYTHGGKRERCKKCQGTNVRRVHHVICQDCGYEHILYPLDVEQEALINEAFDAVQDEPHHATTTKAETITTLDQAIEVIDQALLDISDAPITTEIVTSSPVTVQNTDVVQDEQHQTVTPFGTCSGCGATNDTIEDPHRPGHRICSCYNHPERRDTYRANKAIATKLVPTVNYANGQVEMKEETL